MSEADKQVLTEEGVGLPRQGKKRKREQSATSHTSKVSSHEKEWQEVKKYLDPNPHLRAYDEREAAQKVSEREPGDEATQKV